MSSQVYFGNAKKQLWIKSPATGMAATVQGWSSETQLLNGRNSVRRSKGAHRRFSPSWIGSANATDLSDSLMTIKDFADGLYGDGPFYWVDPYAAKMNILPPHWAAPMLTENDWPNLASSLVPTFTEASVANNYPIKYVTYETVDSYVSTNKLTLIIPSGQTLHFGWHGPSTAITSGIRVVPYLRSTGAADTALNPNRIDVGGTTRTNTTISGTTYSHVEIFIATDTAKTVSVTGMIAQILPSTESVATGAFISGRGTTAIEFNSHPEIEYYSANINNGQIGMSVEWVEV